MAFIQAQLPHNYVGHKYIEYDHMGPLGYWIKYPGFYGLEVWDVGWDSRLRGVEDLLADPHEP